MNNRKKIVGWDVASKWIARYKKEMNEQEYNKYKKDFIDNTIIYKITSNGRLYCSSTSWAFKQMEMEV